MFNLPNILSNRQFRLMAIVIAIIVLVLVLLNVFVIGGDLNIYTLNSSLNAPLAIIVTVSALLVWRLMSSEKHNRSLWLGIVLGWGMWALAELIWAGYSILRRAVPYPSWADFFWALGYIPIGIGLFTRVRAMPFRTNQSQSLIIVGVSAVTILLTAFYIFIPTIQSFDIHRLVESILNFYYPLSDIFLLIIVWRIFFTYEAGDYGFSWRLLTVGFIFLTVADLLFTYTTWHGLYYPDMKANEISRLADVSYTVSYLIWILGIYALRILLKKEHPVRLASRIRAVRTYGNILVYTRSDDTVINTSPNYHRFFGAENAAGKRLADALKISEQAAYAILEKLRAEGKVADLPIQIPNPTGVLQDVRLSGLAVFDTQKQYLGANLLLRMRVADKMFDNDLSPESRALPHLLLEQSGSASDAEIGQFLSDYYLSYIRSLQEMAIDQGGEAMSQALLGQLAETAQEHDWQMHFNSQMVLEGKDYPLEVLRPALPVLLETAKRYVSEITDPVTVEAHMRELGAQISETIHRDVARYSKVERKPKLSNEPKTRPIITD